MDLLERVLADIGDVEIVAIEGVAPRIAEAGQKNLRRAASLRERIGRRDCVGLLPVHIDAQHLSEQRVEVLAVSMRIAAAAAVAHADVEKTVGAEGDPSAVVVRERLIDAEQRRGRVGKGHVRIVGHAVLDDLRVAVDVGVVDEEAAVLRVAGMEGEAEQALLVAAAHEIADVEKGLVRRPRRLMRMSIRPA